jgi:hypothetical protein
LLDEIGTNRRKGSKLRGEQALSVVDSYSDSDGRMRYIVAAIFEFTVAILVPYVHDII